MCIDSRIDSPRSLRSTTRNRLDSTFNRSSVEEHLRVNVHWEGWWRIGHAVSCFELSVVQHEWTLRIRLGNRGFSDDEQHRTSNASLELRTDVRDVDERPVDFPVQEVSGEISDDEG